MKNKFSLIPKKKKTSLLCVFAFAIGCHGLAWATDDFLQDCPFKKGDQLASVKDFYQISADPKALNIPSPGGAKYLYHFAEYGVNIYFDENKRLLELRFERPFNGKIDGISLSDERSKILALNGEPLKKAPGSMDVELAQERARHKLEIVNALPDPAPKDSILKAFSEVEAVNAQPYVANNAWIYKNASGLLVRYDIGSSSNKVQAILAETGTTRLTAVLEMITQQSIDDFFHRSDSSYTNGKMDDYMGRYTKDYVINIKNKPVIDGYRVRKEEVFPVLMTLPPPRLAETVIHTVSIADNGLTAVANVTTTERYRKTIGSIRTVSTVMRNVEHNFANIDEQKIYLALVGGVIKITRTDILNREQTENAGK